MPRRRLVRLLLVAVALLSCTGPTPAPQWYFTCGDAICTGSQPHPGVPPCSFQRPGEVCRPEGDTCDPVDSCNRLLMCAATDPTQGPGGCPISRARFKRDIEYLSEAELRHLYTELRRFRLATYRYRAEGPADRARLGFIIEDVEPSAAVDAERDSVDLYGYASMAVAALQVQARQIESLQAEVSALRHELDTRAPRRGR
jgi:Chaperone of endosialidase